MSELTRTGNSFTWTIRNFYSIASLDSATFTLEGYEDITWYLNYQRNGEYSFSCSNCGNSEVYYFYLVRDYQEDVGKCDVQVDYRIRMSTTSLDVNVSNFYPKTKKENGIYYLKPAMRMWYSGSRPRQDVLVNLDVSQVNVIKTGWPSEVMPKVAASMTKFLADGQFADVMIVVGEEQLKAHKMVLATQSPVFESMFTHDMAENQTNQVEIKDISADVFKAFLHYLYLGPFDEVNKFTDKLISVAHKYQVEVLKNYCEEHLIKTISMDNCLEWLRIGDLFGTKNLVNAAIEFINKHREDWNKIDSFNDFLLKNPKLMLMILLDGTKK